MAKTTTDGRESGTWRDIVPSCPAVTQWSSWLKAKNGNRFPPVARRWSKPVGCPPLHE